MADYDISVKVGMCRDPECQKVHMEVYNHPNFKETVGLVFTDEEWDWIFTQVSKCRLSRPNAKPN